jgi:hypothetical protein
MPSFTALRVHIARASVPARTRVRVAARDPDSFRVLAVSRRIPSAPARPSRPSPLLLSLFHTSLSSHTGSSSPPFDNPPPPLQTAPTPPGVADAVRPWQPPSGRGRRRRHGRRRRGGDEGRGSMPATCRHPPRERRPSAGSQVQIADPREGRPHVGLAGVAQLVVTIDIYHISQRAPRVSAPHTAPIRNDAISHARTRIRHPN